MPVKEKPRRTQCIPGEVIIEQARDGRFIITAVRDGEQVDPVVIAGLLRSGIDGVLPESVKIMSDAVHCCLDPMFHIEEVKGRISGAIKKRMRWKTVKVSTP